uniref:Uncharacterized protein n=1 Tax=Mesoaciditoga lauensis TaxID=1495039 RepID=A0A7V3VT74_9BACT
MVWINFLEALIIVTVIYLPLLVGKSKRNEESLFWASLVSVFLALVATFVVNSEKLIGINIFNYLPILIALIAGFISYGIYGLNSKPTYTKLSPITWLIFLPLTDNLALRHIGLFYTSEWVYKIQILAWYVTVNVFLFAIIAALIFFFIYIRNGIKSALIEAAMAFVIGMIAGYIYFNYGILMAIISEIVFNFWRILFGFIKNKSTTQS